MPSHVGHYVIGDRLGRGGMGEVWSARRRGDDQSVALKVLPAGVSAGNLRAEVRAMAQLDHPHVVTLLDMGTVGAADDVPWPDGAPWFVMERADGDLLSLPPADGSEVIEVLRQVLRGLAHAHAHGVVHRDLKPENVLWVGTEAKLADFGIALHGRVRAGRALGTPAYMAPEAIDGRPGPSSDLYAVGCLAWALVTGRSPFQRDSTRATVRASVRDALPSTPLAGMPEGYRAWIEGLTAKDALQRFACAADALRALEGLAAPDAELPPVRGLSSRSTYVWMTPDEVAPRPRPASTGARPSSAPWPGAWSTLHQRPLPRPRHGAAVATLGLRVPAVMGHDEVMAALWSHLEASSEGLRHVRLVGPRGVGRRALAEQLLVRARELGAAVGAVLTSPLHQALVQELGPDGRSAAEAWGLPRVVPGLDDLGRDNVSAVSLLVEAVRAADRRVVLVATPELAAEVQAVRAALAAGGCAALLLEVGGAPHPEAEEVEVPRLPLPAIRRWVQHLLRVDEDTVHRIAALADGRPRWAEAIVREAQADGRLVLAADGTYQAPSDALLPWPDEAASQARLDEALRGLSDADRELVEAAAHLPDPADLSVASGLGEVRLPVVSVLADGALCEAVRRRVHRAGATAQRAEEALRAAPGSARLGLRAGRVEPAVARALRPEAPLADQRLGWEALDRADVPADDPRRGQVAAALAMGLYQTGAFDTSWYWRKVAVGVLGEDHPDLLVLELNLAIVRRLDPLGAAERLAAQSTDPLHRLLVAKAYRSCGRYREALAIIEGVDSDDERVRTRLLGFSAVLLSCLGHPREAVERADEAVERSRELPLYHRAFRWDQRAEVLPTRAGWRRRWSRCPWLGPPTRSWATTTASAPATTWRRWSPCRWAGWRWGAATTCAAWSSPASSGPAPRSWWSCGRWCGRGRGAGRAWRPWGGDMPSACLPGVSTRWSTSAGCVPRRPCRATKSRWRAR